MRHEDTSLWWLQVVTGFLLFFLHRAPLPDADAPGWHRAVRVRRPRVERHVVAALPGAAVRVEIHGGIGLYRLAVKWGWFEGADPKRTRRRLKSIKWALTAFFLVLGLLTLAAYMKIGIEQPRPPGEEYVPAAWPSPRPGGAGAGDEDRLHRRARHRRRARRAAHGDRRQAPRPRRDHPVAGAAEALALQGRAGRHAGEPRQRDQGAGRQRGRALRGHGARQRLGRRPARSCACSSTPRPRRCASWPPGACRGAACARATARSSSTARRSRSPSATRRTACWRSATSAAPRSGAPATSPTARATRCCTR